MESEVYLRHIANEESHWWFKGRREIIYSIIKKNINFNKREINILDFGAGSGTNIRMLSKYGKVYVYEKDEKTSNFLKEKFKKSENIEIIQKPNNNKEFFDLILAADVIEHVKDDETILKYLSELLDKNGQIINIASHYGVVSPNYKLYKNENFNMPFYQFIINLYWKII